MIFGCDVSENNGDIDFDTLFLEGIRFAICRIGYGVTAGQMDSKFAEYVAKAHKAGLLVGGYYFSYGLTAADGGIEGQNAIDIVTQTGVLLDLPIFYDQEPTPFRDTKMGVGDNGAELTSMTANFLAALKNANLSAGVYSDFDWLSNEIDWQSLKCPVWNAEYSTGKRIAVSDFTGDLYDANYSDSISGYMHQFTCTGTSKGTDSLLDLDIIH